LDALAAYCCPDHGCELEEAFAPDGDANGVWTFAFYECPVGRHTFAAARNGVGDTYPVED
jgi:hypothetical protein